MSAWITGARGFIGRHLARELAAAGGAVAGLGHGHWPAAEAARHGVLQWINGEIVESNLDLLAARAGPPSIVYHLAGGAAVGASLANPAEDYERTVHTTARLLDWIRRRHGGVPVVAVSSAAVYGAGHSGPIPESTAGTPYSPYGYHKAMMESLCRSYSQNFGVRATIARVFSAYGPGLRKQLLWDICTRLRAPAAELALDGTGAETRDWLEIHDVVRALAAIGAAIPSADCPAYNVGTGVGVTVAEVAARVLEAQGDRRRVVFTGRKRSGDPAALIADVRRLAALGLPAPQPLAAGIARYVRWFRAQSDG
jgi:UDP-glucose 4-epimerase